MIVTVFQEMRLPELGEQAYLANTSGGYGEMARAIPLALEETGFNQIAFFPLYGKNGATGHHIDYDSEYVPGANFVANVVYDFQYHPQVVSLYRVKMKNGTEVYGLKDQAADVLYRDNLQKKHLGACLGRMVPAVLKHLGIKPDIVWSHEWAPGLVIPNMANDPYFNGSKSLFTVHSPQGAALNCYPSGEFDSLAINPCYRNIFTQNGHLDPTLGVIGVADLTNGVSIEHGQFCRDRFWQYREKITGVLNGIPRRPVLSPRLRDLSFVPDAGQLRLAQQLDKAEYAAELSAAVGKAIDPREPFIAACRRLAVYKNQLPMLAPNIRHLCAERGAYVIVGGVAHKDDQDARWWEAQFTAWMNDPQFNGRFIYIGRPLYTDEWRRETLRGCDMWFECPFEGTEACGTSGMMAEICGKPVLGTKTGWHKECGQAYDPQTGEGHSFWIDPYNPETFGSQLDRMLDLFYAHRDNGDGQWPELCRRTFIAGCEHGISHMVERYRAQAFEPLLAARV